MKLITDINLELVIQEFYNRISEEFKTADKLSEGRTLTIGETGKVFDGSQDVFWSLNEIGAVSNGTISNLTTTNKTVVTAINELQSKKASTAYVDNAIENVTIDDAVTAVELIGNVEDVEFDFVTQEELDEALANFDDFDIEGMVTAVDVGNVNIDGGTGGQGFDGTITSDKVIMSFNNNKNLNQVFEDYDGWISGLDNAINELFQSANNGKELIASAIGEPLSAEDTFSAMSNDINGLLSTFKTNMMNNGVTVNGSDRFKQLIDKIATLADNEGSGIQFATGRPISGTEESFTQILATGTTLYYDQQLNFTPTYLFMVQYYNGSYTHMSNIGPESMNGSYFLSNVTSTSFTISRMNDREEPLNTFRYYAIGVGEEDTVLRDSLASILQEEGVSVTEEDDMASLISKVDSEFDRQVVPQGTATANDVISGKTFINSTGQLVTGSITSHGTNTDCVSVNGTTQSGMLYVRIPRGAYLTNSSSGYPAINVADSNFVASNIVSGKSIFGVSGTAKTIKGKYVVINWSRDNTQMTSSWQSRTVSHSLGEIPSFILFRIGIGSTAYVDSIKNYDSSTAASVSNTQPYNETFNYYISNITSTSFDVFYKYIGSTYTTTSGTLRIDDGIALS